MYLQIDNLYKQPNNKYDCLLSHIFKCYDDKVVLKYSIDNRGVYIDNRGITWNFDDPKFVDILSSGTTSSIEQKVEFTCLSDSDVFLMLI